MSFTSFYYAVIRGTKNSKVHRVKKVIDDKGIVTKTFCGITEVKLDFAEVDEWLLDFKNKNLMCQKCEVSKI